MSERHKTIDLVIKQLLSALGTKEEPDGSNDNFIVRWYNAHIDRIGFGPWCEMTATWAMHTGGAKPLKKGRAYTVWAAADAAKGVNGSTWHYGTRGMRRGDQVYYDWSSRRDSYVYVDHTGIVEKIHGDGTFSVLEGNVRNQLRRMRRDGKYVVGYIRFDWDSMLPAIEPPKPTVKKPNLPRKTANPGLVRKIQSLLEVDPDGQWGALTDKRALRLRRAARARCGFPKCAHIPFDIEDVQRVIDTMSDGVWGRKSQVAMRDWVKAMQYVLSVKQDGEWGPKTDNAYMKARRANLYKF